MLKTMVEIKSLPYIDIQHDTLAVFDDVSQGIVMKEDIWISGYRFGSTSIHGKARVELEDGGEVSLRSRDGVIMERISKTSFKIEFPSLEIPSTLVKFPRQIIHPPYKKSGDLSPEIRIGCIAHSPNSPHLVVGGSDGYCVVLSTATSIDKVEPVLLKGHVGDVLAVKYFPSGQVILTASLDFSIRIFSALNGSNPRTLTGHTGPVTSLQILGVGRKILSGSKDGSVRLWEVGTAKELTCWRVGDSCEALEFIDESGAEVLGLKNDVSTEAGKDEVRGAVVVGLRSGHLAFWDLSLSSLSSPTLVIPPLGLFESVQVLRMAYSKELRIVVTGHANGVLMFRTLEFIKASLPVDGDSTTLAVEGGITLVMRNVTVISSLAFVCLEEVSGGDERRADLLVGTGSGLPCRLRVCVDGKQKITVDVLEEFAGLNDVGVEGFDVDRDGGVWCACVNGGIRRY